MPKGGSILGKLNPFSRKKRRHAMPPLPDAADGNSGGRDDWEMVEEPGRRRGRVHFDDGTIAPSADPYDISYPPVDGGFDDDDQGPSPTDPADIDDDPDLPYAVDDPPLSRRTVHKCVALLVLLLGLGLLAFGIVLLVTEESVESAEDRYAAAIRAFDSGPRSAMSLWAGTIDGAAAVEEREVLQSVGSAPTTTSILFAADVSVSAAEWAAGVTDVAVRFSPGPNFTMLGVPVTDTVSTAQSCTRDACSRPADETSTENCRTSDVPFICSNVTLGAMCRTRFGAEATYTGLSACVEDPAVCGVCVYPAYLGNLCVVVQPDSTGRAWNRVNTIASCEYPFETRNFSHVRPSVLPVTLRVDTDPYLALEAETRGTGRFAAAPTSVSPWAIALIVFGSLAAIGGLAGGVVILVRPSEEEQEEEAIAKLSIRQRIDFKNAKLLRTARRPANAIESRTSALYHFETVKLDIAREDRFERDLRNAGTGGGARYQAAMTDDRYDDDDPDGAARP